VRVADPNERRSVLATLTETGRERIESTWRAFIEKQAPMAEGLSHEELIQLRHLRLRIVENMQQKLERGFTR
jgi:DNA-binding MarR family transcriptional regulator